MTIFGRRLKPVLEKYVGSDHKEFKIIEGELKKLIAIIKKDAAPMSTVKVNVNELNKSDHVKMIERQFKSFFKLREFSLSWSATSAPNAYTYCRSFMFLDQNYVKESNGRQYNDQMFVGVVLHTGLVTYANVDEKELMAVILHEIGHNFYNSIIHTMSMMTYDIASSVLQMAVMDLIKFNEIIHKFNDAIRNFMSSNFPKLVLIFNTAEDIIYNIGSLFGFANGLLSPVLLLNFISFGWMFRYSVEKHADSFAIDHGYGEPLAKALDKMTLQENNLASKTVYRAPGLKWLYDFCDLQGEVIVGALGGYPSMPNRIRTGLDRLKESSKDPNLDPRVRQELNKQISHYEDYYNNVYLNIDADVNKRRAFTTIYRAWADKVFNGKMDIREFMHALDPASKAY